MNTPTGSPAAEPETPAGEPASTTNGPRGAQTDVGAVVIDTNGATRTVDLPSGRAPWRTEVDRLLGGRAEAARYHRGATLHVNADGATRPNITAWVLACAWRGLELPYMLYGTVVVTGASDGHVLPQTLAAQAERAANAISEVVEEWRGRPPVSDEAGTLELLATVRHHVPSGAR
jgi:hypothetical protein